jgi:hypothetical protein
MGGSSVLPASDASRLLFADGDDPLDAALVASHPSLRRVRRYP